MSEEKIREAIRQALKDQYGLGPGGAAQTPGEGRAYRPHGTEHDAKLEREMPKNVPPDVVEEAAIPRYDAGTAEQEAQVRREEIR